MVDDPRHAYKIQDTKYKIQNTRYFIFGTNAITIQYNFEYIYIRS